MRTRPPAAATRAARFILYVAFVLSIGMALFPPFVSLNGTEYAFVLTGPEWSHRMAAVGRELGLGARLQWELLLGQLAGVWAIALGAKWILAGPPSAPSLLPGLLSLSLCGAAGSPALSPILPPAAGEAPAAAPAPRSIHWPTPHGTGHPPSQTVQEVSS